MRWGLVFVVALCGCATPVNSDSGDGTVAGARARGTRTGETGAGGTGVGGTCRYAGTVYPIGASFPATDGCNTCYCYGGGYVGCTYLGCTHSGTYTRTDSDTDTDTDTDIDTDTDTDVGTESKTGSDSGCGGCAELGSATTGSFTMPGLLAVAFRRRTRNGVPVASLPSRPPDAGATGPLAAR
jgi:hypothetical protein